jgi:hypothetical protein
VAAAIGASWIGLRTLGVIKRQTQEAIGAGLLAEKALHLTERADLLISGVTISTYPQLGPDSVIAIEVKNYGRTRASRVEMKADLLIPGNSLPGGEAPILAAIIGPGGSQPITFGAMHEWMTKELFEEIKSGERHLRFEADIAYFDVFDKRHHSSGKGVFLPQVCTFCIDANQEAD